MNTTDRRCLFLALALIAGIAITHAATGRLVVLRVSWDTWRTPQGASNAVIVIHQAQSLGTVWTRFKPKAYFPASRTNGQIVVLAGQKYQFRATAQYQKGGLIETDPPSASVTYQVEP